MKKLTSAAILIGGAILASQSAFAQTQTFTANDLYFGFENYNGGATEDYIIDLGPASGIVGGSSPVDLSGDFSLSDFNAVLGGSASLNAGVVGGSQYNPPGWDIYATQLRSGGPGNPAMPGSVMSTSEGPISTFGESQISTSIAALSTLNAPTAGIGLLDTSLSWTSDVEPAPNQAIQTFYGNSGIDPSSAIGSGGVLYEDLWKATATYTQGGAFQYEGYFTLDLSGGSPNLTFTPNPTAVPEPTVLGLLGGAGFLLLSFRRRLSRNKA